MSKRTIMLALGVIMALLVGTGVALAANVALPGSNFEIDDDANTTVQGAAPAQDWNNVAEIQKGEEFTGSLDNSFGNGTKENTANPTIIDGGIPPNKSDLKFFGLYQEGGTSSGFLNLYWTRVQDPSGTTNMDFELNQRQCTPGLTPVVDPDCAGNGVTPKRSTGDVLVIYDLSNGGTNATISFRKWLNSDQWGPLTDLTAANQAVGTINTSAISATDSGGLGALDIRTFGEAQISMAALFGTSTDCRSFGSAYLKSRSSDSFTAALKDFITPVPVSITNCGSVNITKTDDANPANALNGAVFTLYNNNAPLAAPRGAEDTATTLNCTTAGTGTDAGKCSISAVPFGNYWVVETTVPTGYTAAADQAAVVSATTPTISLSFVDVRLASTLSTEQSFIPQDTAKVGTVGETGTYSGSLKFELFDGQACAGTAKYTQIVNVPTSQPGATFTTTNPGAPTGYTINASNDDNGISWKVTYTDDVRSGEISDCVEKSTVSITNS
jgi:hypothetical protein